MSLNLLLDTLPEYVLIDGEDYFFDTDFRACIIFEKIIFSDLPRDRKTLEAVSVFFPDKKPTNITEAVGIIIDHYRCGSTDKKKTRKPKKNGKVEIKPRMIYDYEYDAPYIFAAFYGEYGIDLNDIEYLHWWKFHALFEGLPSKTKIAEIMGYRGTDLGSIKSKSEQQRIARLKEIYDLPQNLTFEDKVAMAGMAFGGF